MRKLLIAQIASFFCLGLAACQAAAPISPASDPSLTPNVSPVQPQPTVTLNLPSSSTPPGEPASKPTEAPPATAQPPTQTAAPEVEICSPLAENSLAELPEIVSSPYNPPPMGSDARHQGVDLSYYRRKGRTSIQGEGIQAVFGGQVAASILDSFPFGNFVIIETPASDLPPELVEQLGLQAGQSLYTLYAHMGAAPLVALGDDVTACQLLGEVGKSGNAGVAHLHLEMRTGPASQQFASMAFYSTQNTKEEKDNYVLWSMSGEFQHFDPMSLLTP